MNLKVPGAILPLGCAIYSTRGITVRGVVATPLRRTRVKNRMLSIHHVHVIILIVVENKVIETLRFFCV